MLRYLSFGCGNRGSDGAGQKNRRPGRVGRWASQSKGAILSLGEDQAESLVLQPIGCDTHNLLRYAVRLTVVTITSLVIMLVAGACGASNSSDNLSSGAGTAKSSASTVATAVAPGVPQNDDYITSYGRKASGYEAEKITAEVERYYALLARRSGARACVMLSPSLAASVVEDYAVIPGLHGHTCGAVLAKVAGQAGHSSASLLATKVTGVRLRGNRGFVQLTAPRMPTGEIAIERHSGVWSIEALVGRSCSDCAAR